MHLECPPLLSPPAGHLQSYILFRPIWIHFSINEDYRRNSSGHYSMRLTWIDVLTVVGVSHIWSISCLLQDDVYKAGGGGGQRLWLCCFGGWANCHQRTRGGQQAQSEGREGSRWSNWRRLIGMNNSALLFPVGGAKERSHVRCQDPRCRWEGWYRSDQDRCSGKQLEIHRNLCLFISVPTWMFCSSFLFFWNEVSLKTMWNLFSLSLSTFIVFFIQILSHQSC